MSQLYLGGKGEWGGVIVIFFHLAPMVHVGVCFVGCSVPVSRWLEGTPNTNPTPFDALLRILIHVEGMGYEQFHKTRGSLHCFDRDPVLPNCSFGDMGSFVRASNTQRP